VLGGHDNHRLTTYCARNIALHTEEFLVGCKQCSWVPSTKHIQHQASRLCLTALAWDGGEADDSEVRPHTLWQGPDLFGLGVDRRTYSARAVVHSTPPQVWSFDAESGLARSAVRGLCSAARQEWLYNPSGGQ
jgi:hypothetical protein